MDAISLLLVEMSLLKSQNKDLLDMLKILEWQDYSDVGYDYTICQICLAQEHEGHDNNCKLGMFLKSI